MQATCLGRSPPSWREVGLHLSKSSRDCHWRYTGVFLHPVVFTVVLLCSIYSTTFATGATQKYFCIVQYLRVVFTAQYLPLALHRSIFASCSIYSSIHSSIYSTIFATGATQEYFQCSIYSSICVQYLQHNICPQCYILRTAAITIALAVFGRGCGGCRAWGVVSGRWVDGGGQQLRKQAGHLAAHITINSVHSKCGAQSRSCM